MTSGVGFHCHHDRLVEWMWDFEERVAYIKASKPEGERPLRLRLFKLIPPELLPPEVARTCAEVDGAWTEAERTEAARVEADRTGFEVSRAKAEADRVWVEVGRARAEVDRAIRMNLPALEELHTRLCLDCPWDGKTIFPEVSKVRRQSNV